MLDVGRNRSLLLVLLAGLVFGVSSLAYPRTSIDSPLFTYVADTILQGGLPYRDAWDMKSPGIFFAYALELFLMGRSAVGLRMFDIAWQLCTAMTLVLIARRFLATPGFAWIAGFSHLFLYYSQEFWSWAQPDGWLSLPLAMSILFLARGVEYDRSPDWSVAGVGVALAALFKLPFGLVGVVLLLVALKAPWRDKTVLARRLVSLALGFLAPLLVVVVFFAVRGGLSDLVTTQFHFVPEYVRQLHDGMTGECVLKALARPVALPLYGLVGLGIASAVFSSGWRRKKPVLGWALVGWLCVGVLVVVWHGHYLGYHFLPLLAQAAILSAVPMCTIIERRWERRGAFVALLVFLTALSLVSARKLVQHARFGLHVLQTQKSADAWEPIGSYLRQRTSPEDRIQVWGNVPAIYVHAQRRASSRFFYALPVAGAWEGLDFRQLFLQEFTENKPAYFILVKAEPRRHCPATYIDEWADFQNFEALKQKVQTEYEVEDQSEACCVVFRRRM